MRLLLLVCLVATMMASSQVQAQPSQDTSATDLADRFYRTYLKLKINGLPDSKQYEELSPFLSKDLQELFRSAQREQARAIKENPNEKGPWVDGDLFTSLFEGAQSFKLGQPKKVGKYTQIPVSLEYHGGGSTTRWEDSLVLIETKEGWRVFDILLKGDWQFKTGSSLRSVLGAK